MQSEGFDKVVHGILDLGGGVERGEGWGGVGERERERCGQKGEKDEGERGQGWSQGVGRVRARGTEGVGIRH